MKKVLMFAAALTLGAASATPFVHPADRTVSKPSDVKMGGTLRMTVAGDFDTYNPLVAQGRPNIPELTDAGGLLGVDPYTYEYIPVYGPELYPIQGQPHLHLHAAPRAQVE